jgi:hypothetical protein
VKAKFQHESSSNSGDRKTAVKKHSATCDKIQQAVNTNANQESRQEPADPSISPRHG